MLLIDGVRYEEWEPKAEEEFERAVTEHAQDIFGEKSIYLDMKRKLRSGDGTASIPDGYVITLGNNPQWHVIEVELSSHPLHEHIISQISKFIDGTDNLNTKNNLINAIYSEVTADDFLKLKLKQQIGAIEIHKFLSDLISKQPILTVIIEKHPERARDILKKFATYQTNVIQFRTFVREKTELVHAHLFEPLWVPTTEPKPSEVIEETEGMTAGQKAALTRRLNREKALGPEPDLKSLISANIIKPGQLINKDYKGQPFEAKILADGSIVLAHNNKTFTLLSMAAKDITGINENGWRWWYTTKDDGTECKMDDLRH